MISPAFKRSSVNIKKSFYAAACKHMTPLRMLVISVLTLAAALEGMAYDKDHAVADPVARKQQLNDLNAGLDKLTTLKQDYTAAGTMEKMIATPGTMTTQIDLVSLQRDAARLYDAYMNVAKDLSLGIAFAGKISTDDTLALRGRLSAITGKTPDYLDYKLSDENADVAQACFGRVAGAPGFAPSETAAESLKQCVVTDGAKRGTAVAAGLGAVGLLVLGGFLTLRRWEKRLPKIEEQARSEEAARRAAETAEKAKRTERAVQDATILKGPTKVSAPLKLKSGKPPAAAS